MPRDNAIISEPDTLMSACIMDATLVSAMGTAAASGIVAKYLVNRDSEVMGVVGASVQGMTQASALKLGVPLLEVCNVFDINT
ncbi:MAG: ornithine cyclodeaminase/alanine dehydrogenase-like protein (mu-crystallin family) [Clostridium sp.]